MTRRLAPSRWLGTGVVGLAALLSFTGVPITSAQGDILFAPYVQGTLPVDAPFDPAWAFAPALDVVLSGQTTATPRLIVPSVPSIRARALTDGTRFAVMLEWSDATIDDSVLGVDRFADGAAMQFALGSGTSVCMGQQAGGLNIWHWKADWAADMAAGRRLDLADVHPGMPQDEQAVDGHDPGPDGFMTGRDAGNLRSGATLVSSVEDLDAAGFGTLTSQPPDGQNVHGSSEHRDGVWRVVMSRALAADASDAVLVPGGPATVVAFAVWDGSHGDRNGQKSVSAWLGLTLLGPGTAGDDGSSALATTSVAGDVAGG